MARRMTLEEFIEKVNLKYNGKISVLSTVYNNNKTPVIVKCNDCSEERSVVPNKLLSDSCCPTCSGKKQITTEQYKEEIKELVGDEYTLVGKYKNTGTPIFMIHNKCGHEWKISRSNFIFNNNRCPECSHPSRRKDDETFKKEFEILSEGKFRLLSNYGKDNQTPVAIQCIRCDLKMEKTPNVILSDGYVLCPDCDPNSSRKQSVGIRKICEFLDKSSIIYQKEKKFNDFRNYKGDYYSYDIFISSMKLLIEFDGEQHFKLSPRTSKEDLRVRRKLDMKKDDYVLNKNLNLLRVSYKEFRKIPEILDSILLKKSSTTIRRYNLLFINRGKTFSKEKYYTSRSSLQAIGSAKRGTPNT
jgi:very-short-patch-repair endonuclease